MLHVLLDSCIYRSDRKRIRSAFRVLTRLAAASKLQLHVPAYVKGEVLSQQQHEIDEHIAKIKAAADAMRRITEEAQLTTASHEIEKIANEIRSQAPGLLSSDFQTWLGDIKAIEHPVQPDYGERVTEAYFAGEAPFRAPKAYQDFPDAFIWQTALDLVKEHGELIIVSSDGRLRTAAEDQAQMEAYDTLDRFIESSECKDALEELTTNELVTENLERVKQRLPNTKDELVHRMENDLVNELAEKHVRHWSIPEDNHEAMILMVGAPKNVEFAYDKLAYYGEADIGIPFTAAVECLLNYRIYKTDYYSLSDDKQVSVDEWNDHYFDAEEYYEIDVEGEIAILIGPDDLKEQNLTDDDLENIIKSADMNTEVHKIGVSEPSNS